MTQRLKRTLLRVNVVSLVVDTTIVEMTPCRAHGNGYIITRQLYACYKSIQADTTRTYGWIFRLRTDHNTRIRFSSLPRAHAYYSRAANTRGVALLADVGGCACGWKLDRCNHELYPCSRANDQFAILHGSAIAAYLMHLRRHYCDSEVLNVPQSTFSRLGSEERLGLILSAYNVTMHDVRWVSSAMSPQLHRTIQCTESNYNFTLLKKGVMLNPLPAGPWDQRRQGVCQNQRRLPSSDRTMCLPVEGVYDDVRYGKDVVRMLK